MRAELAMLNMNTAPVKEIGSGEPTVIRDLRQYKPAPESVTRGGLMSAVIAPLKNSDASLMGILCAGSRSLDAFNKDDIRLLKLMSAQISIAASNSIHYEDTVRYSDKMLARNRIVSTLTSSLMFDEMFDAFAEEIGKLVEYDRISVVMLSQDETHIETIVSRGGCPMVKDDSFPMAGSVVEWIVENKQPVKRGDLKSEARFSWDSVLAEAGVRSSLNLPLIVENKVIGALNFYSDNKDFFSDEIVVELQPIADQLALALANQSLFDHVARAKLEWETTFDAVTEGIVVVNEDHVIVRLNQAAAELLGSSVDELTGSSCRTSLHGLISGNSTCALQDPQQGMDSIQFEAELPDGKTLEVVIDSVFDESGKFTGGAHFLRDISESKQMRQRLLTSEKMVAVGQLVSGVAHEINNPLTGITGYAQLLMMREDIDEKTRADAEAIATEADRATRIVRQLLSFARKHQPARELANVNDIVRDCVGLKGYDLKVNNVEIRTSLDEALPGIAVDSHQIQQVFINMITNAEQAIHENDKAGTLEISSSVSDGKVRVTFIDDGPGVPAEGRTRLFDPFFTTKDVGKGTGLGLSVCYGIIQEHDGSIWAEEPEEGTGAVFVIELPVAAAATKIQTGEDAQSETVTGRILMIDDDESVREVLTETLRRVGHEVDAAANGEEALKLIGNNEYDCVISDVKMPVMTGAELHLAVKSINPEAAARFIFISGDTVNEETRRYLESISNPSLSKPFSLQELEEELQKMLDGRQKAA
jgi:two-component system NtrC family sensor kinase